MLNRSVEIATYAGDMAKVEISLSEDLLDQIDLAAEIAAQHRLTSYDAAYVAVARRHDWTPANTRPQGPRLQGPCDHARRRRLTLLP
jgi:hypothetical protein